MKAVISHFIIVLALIPQFFFDNYLMIVWSITFLGILFRYYFKRRNVFSKIFILETVTYSIFLFFTWDRLFYLPEIMLKFGISEYILIVILVVFNALNISVLFYTGYCVCDLLIKLKLINSSKTHLK